MRGEDNPNAKIGEVEAMEIRMARGSVAEIARRHGRDWKLVKRIKAGETWGHLDCPLVAPVRGRGLGLVDRFWSKVERGPEGSEECWMWVGATVHPMPYGRIQSAGRYLLAHRVSYEINVGPIPKGLCVLHRCDNPRCVRPDHLFLGTRSDNAADRHAKGRSRGGSNRGAANGRWKGER